MTNSVETSTPKLFVQKARFLSLREREETVLNRHPLLKVNKSIITTERECRTDREIQGGRSARLSRTNSAPSSIAQRVDHYLAVGRFHERALRVQCCGRQNVRDCQTADRTHLVGRLQPVRFDGTSDSR